MNFVAQQGHARPWAINIGRPVAAALVITCFSLWLTGTPLAMAAGTVHRATSGEPDTLDPHKTFGATGVIVEFDLFEGLMTFDADGNSTWGLAYALEKSDDGLVYTFNLRDGLVWSDGTPFGAQDFVYSFHRLFDPETAAVQTPLYDALVNGRAIIEGAAPVADLGISAPDNVTVEFRLERPQPYFPKLLALLGALPVPRHAIEQYGRDWTKPGNLVSNAAFTLAERQAGSFIRLQKNPVYYAQETVKIDTLYYYLTENLNAAFQRFRAGELDMLFNFPPSKIDWIRENIPETLRISPRIATSFVIYNTQSAPFDDVRVRKALTLAIDRDIIVNRLMRNGSTIARSLIPPQVTNYTMQIDPWLEKPLEARQTEARRLLAEAGFRGATPLAVTLTYFTQEEQQRVSVALQGMWREIGIDAEIINVELRAMAKKRQTGDFQLLLSSTRPGFDDPIVFLTQYESGNIRRNGNPSRYANPAFDDLVAQSERTLDPQERRTLLEQAEKILLDDYPIAPIWFFADHRLVSPQLKGWTDNPLGPHLSRHFSLDP